MRYLLLLALVGCLPRTNFRGFPPDRPSEVSELVDEIARSFGERHPSLKVVRVRPLLAGWGVKRHPLTGIIQNRSTIVDLGLRSTGGQCGAARADVEQEYIDGEWQTIYVATWARRTAMWVGPGENEYAEAAIAVVDGVAMVPGDCRLVESTTTATR